MSHKLREQIEVELAQLVEGCKPAFERFEEELARFIERLDDVERMRR